MCLKGCVCVCVAISIRNNNIRSARIAQWLQRPTAACVVPGSSPGMIFEDFFYEYWNENCAVKRP